MKPAALKLVLSAGLLEGLAALGWLLRDRSMERNAVFLGYSANRLAMAFLVMLPLALLAWLALRAFRQPARMAEWLSSLDAWLQRGHRLLIWTVLLFGLVLLAAVYLVLAASLPSPALDSFLAQFSAGLPLALERLRPVITRAVPVALWLALLAAQFLALLRVSYPQAIRRLWQQGSFGRLALALLLVLLAAAHWAILVFGLKTLLVVPGWKWYFHDKPLALPGLVLFAALVVFTLAAIPLVLRRRAAPGRALVVLVVLGASLQISFGFLEGGAFESLRVKYAGSVFNNYAEAAAREPGWIEPLRDYEARYGSDWYLGTKPPGVLLVYIATQKLSNLVAPLHDSAARFHRLTAFAAYVFPWLSFLVLVPLASLARRLAGEDDSLPPALLYITTPVVLLIPLFLDQVLYPLVFVLVLLLTLRAMRAGSLWLSFATGAAIYAALYFSFSLLPLIPLPVLWLALDGWLRRRERPVRLVLLQILALLAGILVAALLLRLALNYDPLLRYQNAMLQHRRAKEFLPGLPALLEALWLNQVEFFTWMGLPLTAVFLASVVLSLRRWLRGRAAPLDALLLASAATYTALNLFGQTRGEVQRLWLFWLPLVCLFSAPLLRRLFRPPALAFALFALLQLITALLIFRFQDFYG